MTQGSGDSVQDTKAFSAIQSESTTSPSQKVIRSPPPTLYNRMPSLLPNRQPRVSLSVDLSAQAYNLCVAVELHLANLVLEDRYPNRIGS